MPSIRSFNQENRRLEAEANQIRIDGRWTVILNRTPAFHWVVAANV
jgi:hypothetical protein